MADDDESECTPASVDHAKLAIDMKALRDRLARVSSSDDYASDDLARRRALYQWLTADLVAWYAGDSERNPSEDSAPVIWWLHSFAHDYLELVERWGLDDARVADWMSALNQVLLSHGAPGKLAAVEYDRLCRIMTDVLFRPLAPYNPAGIGLLVW